MLARMMRSPIWSTSLLVGLCLLLVGLVLLPVACAASTPATAVTSPTLTPCISPTATNVGTPPQIDFPGGPAITPHLNLAANAASVASGGTATLPTFTADDARAWVTAHLLPGYQAIGTVTIRSVTFVSQEQANQWANLGLALGLPACTPVCVVVLDGSFPRTGLLAGGPGSTPPPPPTFSHVILGFNGVTGNFMDTGWTNSLPAALAAPATSMAGSTPTTGTTPGTGASTPTS